ncbi:hypothetical protein RchiOBHm_Chr6g0245791 [Rosa chinensis]|uniref:Secreted protein n=1 Tax=Rosa chinensis TaxID=74649 RepID=A0A2P6PJD0_ROSCH|nr:hypothetical protein RchiOBHm_Chr6g0245791 [Rosa chinensis]
MFIFPQIALAILVFHLRCKPFNFTFIIIFSCQMEIGHPINQHFPPRSPRCIQHHCSLITQKTLIFFRAIQNQDRK